MRNTNFYYGAKAQTALHSVHSPDEPDPELVPMHYNSVTIVKIGGVMNPALLDYMHEAFVEEANTMGIHAIALERGA